jgi:hypothetical protein
VAVCLGVESEDVCGWFCAHAVRRALSLRDREGEEEETCREEEREEPAAATVV